MAFGIGKTTFGNGKTDFTQQVLLIQERRGIMKKSLIVMAIAVVVPSGPSI